MQKSNKLRQYQIDGVNKLIAFNRDAILADEPGLGKTIQTAHYINTKEPKTVLVVCPASLRINWRMELDKWVEVPIVLQVLSYEGATKLAEDSKFDLVIFDEAHYLKNPKAKRTKACLSLKAERRFFLTGTPIVNKPIDMFPILKSIGLKLSWVEFGKRFCAGYRQLVKLHPKKFVWNFNGASNQEQLNRVLTDNCMVRRRKADVLTELPPKIRQVISLDVKVKEDTSLRETVMYHYQSFNDINEVLNKLPIAFTELAEYRLEQARAKLPSAVEYINDLKEDVGKVVVFAYHREILEALRDSFENSVIVYGGMTDKQKQKAVDDFQRGTADVFVGQITAAGTGLTLTAASTVVFVELDWVPGNIIQAEDRCHRIGQTEPVHVIHLVVKDSIDANIVQALVRKQNMIDSVINKVNV